MHTDECTRLLYAERIQSDPLFVSLCVFDRSSVIPMASVHPVRPHGLHGLSMRVRTGGIVDRHGNSMSDVPTLSGAYQIVCATMRASELCTLYPIRPCIDFDHFVWTDGVITRRMWTV